MKKELAATVSFIAVCLALAWVNFALALDGGNEYANALSAVTGAYMVVVAFRVWDAYAEYREAVRESEALARRVRLRFDEVETR